MEYGYVHRVHRARQEIALGSFTGSEACEWPRVTRVSLQATSLTESTSQFSGTADVLPGEDDQRWRRRCGD